MSLDSNENINLVEQRISSTSCKGRFSPTSDEVKRKLVNRLKSLSAILGRIYPSIE